MGKKKKILRRPISSTTVQPVDQGAFLVCSDGRCFDPSTQEEISADTDLNTSATSKLPEDVMRLIEEMRILEEEEENEEIRKNHIKLLLETAKVEVPAEAPGQKILETDDLVEMLRSQGILPAIENAIPAEELEKEIIDLEEDFGVPEMERLDDEPVEAPASVVDQIRFLESVLPINESVVPISKDGEEKIQKQPVFIPGDLTKDTALLPETPLADVVDPDLPLDSNVPEAPEIPAIDEIVDEIIDEIIDEIEVDTALLPEVPLASVVDPNTPLDSNVPEAPEVPVEEIIDELIDEIIDESTT